MGDKGAFGFDSDDFDRMMHEASEGLRDAVERIGRYFPGFGARPGWSSPATAGEAGDGVWAIYTVDDAGGAHVEEVYAAELDALRANQRNTDPKRRVRFLPYGIAASVLDDSDETP